jgi:catechol 2,3-dioxygenase-like lactoylglutathione lyase family enzyme
LPEVAVNLTVVGVRPFVPASDFDTARAFYRRLGFDVGAAGGDVASIRHGDAVFLLQKFDPPGFIGNYMLSLVVEDVDAWHAHVVASRVLEECGGRIAEPPADRAWGMRDFALVDPSGVLWRVAQPLR